MIVLLQLKAKGGLVIVANRLVPCKYCTWVTTPMGSKTFAATGTKPGVTIAPLVGLVSVTLNTGIFPELPAAKMDWIWAADKGAL